MASKPIHEIRVGLILARIHERRNGKLKRHVVTVVRLFRNGDVWKESTRFGTRDLPVVQWVLDKAHTWLLVRSLQD